MSIVVFGLNYRYRYRSLVKHGVCVCMYGGEESDYNGSYGPA